MFGIGLPEIIIILIGLNFIVIMLIIPVLIVYKSSRLDKDKKTSWIFIALLFSWLGVIVFFITNPKKY